MVGQAGLYQAAAIFLVAYFMTVLSICAISTNGALDAGGGLLYPFGSSPVLSPTPGLLRVLARWV